MTPGPGDTFDRYRIEAVIGAGGMGRVLRAFDPKLRRRVAIKVLAQGASGDAEQVASVLREAQAAAALDHPGVVSVFDVGEAEGHPFIVMEYVEGRSLRSLVGKVSPGDALRWLTDIARALAAAHRAGLVHRDIKPENVMVRDDGAVKLLDFGIARRLDQGAPSVRSGVVGVAASTVAGTPSYMAPEQVQRLVIDPRTDQFGWGVLAYELLSGALPWQSLKDGVPAMVAVVAERQPTLRTAALGLPEHVGAVVDQALEKAPAGRFASMDDLVSALEGRATPRAVSWPGGAAEATTKTETGEPTEPGRSTLTARGGAQSEAFRDRSTVEAPGAEPTAEAPGLASTNKTASETRTGVPAAPRSRAWWPWAALAALLGVVVGAVVLRGQAPSWLPGAPAAWRPGAAALAAYAEGLRRSQNGALSAGAERFKVAIEHEPEFAAAHLRLAVVRWVDGSPASGRESHAAASRRRQRLDARDQAILDALAPCFEGPTPGTEDAVRRLVALERRFPGDAEILLLRPMILATAGRNDEGVAAFQAYLGGHEGVATAWLGLALLRGRRDELELAREAIARCTAIEPRASDCVWLGAQLAAHAGQCESARNVGSSRLLPSARRILAGDLAEADLKLGALAAEAALDKADDARLHELRAALHDEMGDLPGAAAVAAAFLERRGHTPGPGDTSVEQIASDPTVIFQGVLLAAGRIDQATFSARRAAWSEAWRGRGLTPDARELWARSHAGPARGAEDARAALAALSPLGPPRRFVVGRLPGVDAARVYLLAGRAEEAIPLLREATASCLATSEPVRFVQAHALLGRALEALGDTAGACAAYDAVMERWGKARPRSVTAEEASARRDALRCEPAGKMPSSSAPAVSSGG